MGDRPVSDGWTAGNANEDAADTRGWLVGHFIDPSQGVRASKDVEVKWANHPAGDKRPEWTSDDQRTTLVMLVSGEFRVEVTGGGKIMTRQGDYVMWGPGIDHSWEALADSVVLTVRWPSAT
ncbi:signal peptidase I [Amycolatopsis sp. MtRt-6]|uniref:signal peptidase I n=1 Tax=Amycolatopsis sp. lyj-346 TaxID=2789289 RepID=UPI001F5CF228